MNPASNFNATRLSGGFTCRRVCLALLGISWFTCGLNADDQVTFPQPDIINNISVDADKITHWIVGQYEVLHLQGNVRIGQASLLATANSGLVWIEIPEDPAIAQMDSIVDPRRMVNDQPVHKVIAYLEDQVIVDLNGAQTNSTERIVDQQWLGRLFTTGTVDLEKSTEALVGQAPDIFARGSAALSAGITTAVDTASFQTPGTPENRWSEPRGMPPDNLPNADLGTPQMVVNPQTGQLQILNQPQPPQWQPANETAPGPPGAVLPGNDDPATTSGLDITRSNFAPQATPQQPSNIEITGRDSSIDLNLKNFVNPNNPNERVSTSIGGIRLVIDSPSVAQLSAFSADRDRKLYVLADSMVYWQLTLPDGSKRNQFYLEGNIVFAKGSRVIYAERMFYDVEAQQGTILKAEVLTTINNFQGAVRLKADVVQQLDQNNLKAFGSAFTSSRLGVPRYWLQSESIGIRQTGNGLTNSLVFDPQAPGSYTGTPPATDGSGAEDEFLVDSRQNRVYVAGVPVFAWPRLQTNLNNPTLYLESLGINNDRVFGFQIRTGWNMDQILGLQSPSGTKWIGNLDYLSDRGLGFGSEYSYRKDGLFGIPGKVRGNYESWFIKDHGLDNLGRDRRELTPEETFRGRSILQHRHDFAPGYQLRAELGYISDRNFLEQYYERDWDTGKDATTGLWLERNVGTDSFNLTGDLQINEFFTQTSGIQFDHFKLGQPIFNNRLIWHGHSEFGYQRMREATAPLDPVDAAKFDPLAWETDVDGFQAGTRQEIDLPLQFGPVKVVPYLLGDATYWQEALDGNDLLRVYGQSGVRASLPMWRVDPSIQSVLWNVNGLAHKISFDIDASYSDASQDLSELALYDPLDDDSQEAFRRRFAFDTFNILPGQNTPIRFDERNFALRSGMQGLVTGASKEIADDLSLIKLGVHQRWQTKRGLPGRQRIIDWITLDLQTTLFPKADEDNFGSDFGMFDYDFRWYVGDRLSLVSDGYFDFFSQGLRTASFGANIGRPESGNAYVGYRMIEGPISSNILTAAMAYRMSDKWGVKAGGQVDFGETGTIGQTLSMIYIGESFLWQFGFNYDYSRENFGVRFGFEPRFTSSPKLFRPGGAPIAPAGSRWLE